MSEAATEREAGSHETVEQTEQTDQQQTGDESHDESATGTDWKTEAQKWEKRAKANKDAADKLTELEKSQMTEQQRLERERDEARTTAENNGVELARLRAAMKYGLDADDLDLLGTGSDDEIDARAKRLSERLASSTKKPATRRPAEQLRGGADPEQEPEETDVRKIGARMFQH